MSTFEQGFKEELLKVAIEYNPAYGLLGTALKGQQKPEMTTPKNVLVPGDTVQGGGPAGTTYKTIPGGPLSQGQGQIDVPEKITAEGWQQQAFGGAPIPESVKAESKRLNRPGFFDVNRKMFQMSPMGQYWDPQSAFRKAVRPGVQATLGAPGKMRRAAEGAGKELGRRIGGGEPLRRVGEAYSRAGTGLHSLLPFVSKGPGGEGRAAFLRGRGQAASDIGRAIGGASKEPLRGLGAFAKQMGKFYKGKLGL
jgi:hypothetical protein